MAVEAVELAEKVNERQTPHSQYIQRFGGSRILEKFEQVQRDQPSLKRR
jgi:hypothetical protein